MKIFIGIVLFILLNFMIIPWVSLYNDNKGFYIGVILHVIQITVGFAVIYDTIVNMIQSKMGDDE